MTKAQKKTIASILEMLKSANNFEEQRDGVDSLKTELEEKYEEMSERVQEGEKGAKIQEEIGAMQEIYDALDAIDNAIDNAIYLIEAFD